MVITIIPVYRAPSVCLDPLPAFSYLVLTALQSGYYFNPILSLWEQKSERWSNLPSVTQASLIAQCIKNPPAMQETPVRFLSWGDPWRRDRLPTSVFLGFPCVSAGREPAHNVGDLGLIPGLGRSPGEGIGYPLQYSGLENSMDSIVHGVTKSQTWLSHLHFHTAKKGYSGKAKYVWF